MGLAVASVISLLVTLRSTETAETAEETQPRQAGSSSKEIQVELIPESDEMPLEKVLRVSEVLYSGGEPKSEEAFEALAKLGVKTVVSVDGAKPRVEEAKEHGIRYVHIPIGYDGIHEDEMAALLSVTKVCDLPIYVHCHHGQHRAPAAATILAKALEHQFLRPDRTDILVAADTGVQYPGLWDTARNFELPEYHVPMTDLPEIASGGTDADAMAQMDRTLGNLKKLAGNDWKPVESHPDITSQRESVLLWEQLVEWKRLDTEKRSDEFEEMTATSIESSHALMKSLEEEDFTAARNHLDTLRVSCKECHRSYRN